MEQVGCCRTGNLKAALGGKRTLGLLSHYAAESQVRCRCVDGLRHAGGGPVTPAIVRGAQMRAAFHHLASNLDLRLAWVEASFPFRASRIGHGAARLFDLAVLLIPVGSPLPDVTGHVVKTEAIRWERRYW